MSTVDEAEDLEAEIAELFQMWLELELERRKIIDQYVLVGAVEPGKLNANPPDFFDATAVERMQNAAEEEEEARARCHEALRDRYGI